MGAAVAVTQDCRAVLRSGHQHVGGALDGVTAGGQRARGEFEGAAGAVREGVRVAAAPDSRSRAVTD